MNKIILTALFGAMASLPAVSQQVLFDGNLLSGCDISSEGCDGEGLQTLVDGSDMTVFSADNVTSASFIFDSPHLVLAKGINVVAGADLAKAPSRMTLYGRNGSGEDWTAIGRFTTGVSFEAPYTSFTGRTLASTVAYSSFKLEITKIKEGSTLEIAEVQLLGIPVDAVALNDATNGTFTASDNVQNLWAADGSNLLTAVGFKNAAGEYGVENTWLQFTFDSPRVISGYSIGSTLNSAASSRPKAWELLASDDGEVWHTLDMRCNEGSADVDTYRVTRSLEKSDVNIDFAAVADELHEMLYSKFYRDWGGGKYLIHAWNEDAEKINDGYNYWWMAHAIDAYIDAYVRTGESKYQTRARQIKQGMYTAYDAGRQDLWNSFFDDMEWMNLACIRGYENFKIDKNVWLEEAEQLFGWIWEGWNYDNGSEGGIRWNSGTGTGKNSCSNAPAMIGAAKLYNLTGREEYLEKAVMIFDWMLTHSRFEDGFIKDAPDNENRGWAFTYNQGTWVGGLLELYRITGEQKYYDIAVDLIDKSIDSRWYSPDGIMREQGASDGGLFKGIYIRYITEWAASGLLDPERQFRYCKYLVENARSMYDCAINKPEWRVMPDWKTRAGFSNGEPNGGTDGSYHSSIVLSALFLCESVDRLRREGFLNDDYSVKNPAAGTPYSMYRLKVTANNGASDVQIGSFSLYGSNESASLQSMEVADADISVVSRDGRISVVAPVGSFVESFTPDGRCVLQSYDACDFTPAHPGIYIVRVATSAGVHIKKIVL